MATLRARAAATVSARQTQCAEVDLERTITGHPGIAYRVTTLHIQPPAAPSCIGIGRAESGLRRGRHSIVLSPPSLLLLLVSLSRSKIPPITDLRSTDETILAIWLGRLLQQCGGGGGDTGTANARSVHGCGVKLGTDRKRSFPLPRAALRPFESAQPGGRGAVRDVAMGRMGRMCAYSSSLATFSPLAFRRRPHSSPPAYFDL
ncbi:hypothetical protein B0H16DRAFT_1688058 [Mycena metata]|uniref:Uncharacterized protein n=1 Tax=Mycena metata TaxID=1033252 RepID=A0AAD7JEA1_9AGAR|nr:hypothetical protein B0H16DRAFT_1688058 [Mycena metata]